MYPNILFYIIKSIIFFIFFKILSLSKISLIYGSFHSSLTLFNAAIPVIFNSSLIGKLYFISHLFTYKILYKIPGIINIISFSLLKHRASKLNKTICLFLFIILSYLFIFKYNNTFLYTLPWLFCIGYILMTFKKEYNTFDIAFVSTWLTQASGTVIYGILNGFLSKEMYSYVFPISVIERFLCILTIFLCFYIFPYIDTVSKKLLNYCLYSKSKFKDYIENLKNNE